MQAAFAPRQGGDHPIPITVGYAIDARRFPDETPTVYRPFDESGAVYRRTDEVMANLKDNDLLDLGT